MIGHNFGGAEGVPPGENPPRRGILPHGDSCLRRYLQG
nr:MAG TPA: hypothetical protein [Caudoviricetes sp.]